MSNDLRLTMRSVIERIATGPGLSKDIPLEEARLGLNATLANPVDPVQAGIFIIALRIERETADERKGILDAVPGATEGGRRERRPGRHR